MKKKISLMIVAVLAFVGAGSFFAMACDHGDYSEFENPQWYQNFDFQVSVSNGHLHGTWKPFEVPAGQTFLYYKFVGHATIWNPVYPDQSYLKAIWDINQTAYSHPLAVGKTLNVRVCAITKNPATMKKARYCSTPYKVTGEGTVTNNGGDTGSTTTITPSATPQPQSNLTDSMKAALDILMTKFGEKLDDKYGDDVDAKKNHLEDILTRLTVLLDSGNVKNKALYQYVQNKLQEMIDLLTVQSLFNLD